jgi:hypothetical protein
VGIGATGTSGNEMTLIAGGSDVVRIDSSGNVGIGTSSPSGNLHVAGGEIFFKNDAGNCTVSIGASDSGNSAIYLGDPSDGDVGRILYNHANNYMSVNVNASERMRITSDGDVLVSKTARNTGVIGCEMRDDGLGAFTRSNAEPLLLNRTSSDGNLILFRKDAANVGSIGTPQSGIIYIQSEGDRSGFQFGTSNIYPRKNNALSDNATDLGNSSYRYKDLYLGGGLYVGGTASTNKLDHYETGTWTPSVTGSTGAPTITQTNSGDYVRIGEMVYLRVNLAVSTYSGGSGLLHITGLPFASTGMTLQRAGGVVVYNTLISKSGTNVLNFYTDQSAGAIQVRAWSQTSNTLNFSVNLNDMNNGNGSNKYLQGEFWYRTIA